MTDLQTGVDKLMQLIRDKKKLSTEEASQIVGVSMDLIRDWADFLHDEGLIDIKYGFARTFLIVREQTHEDLQRKLVQITGERETFIGKAQSIIEQINSESKQFATFKQEFEDLKKDLGSNLGDLQSDFEKYKAFTEFKHHVAADLDAQYTQFLQKQQQVHATLKHEHNEYQQLTEQFSAEERKLLDEKERIREMLTSDDKIREKIAQYTRLLDSLGQKVSAHAQQLSLEEQSLDKLRQRANQCKADLEEIRTKSLVPLEKLGADTEIKLQNVESTIVSKAHLLERNRKTPPNVGHRIEHFLAKKQRLDNVLHSIEHQKTELIRALDLLQKKASVHGAGEDSLQSLEQQLTELENKKTQLETLMLNVFHTDAAPVSMSSISAQSSPVFVHVQPLGSEVVTTTDVPFMNCMVGQGKVSFELLVQFQSPSSDYELHLMPFIKLGDLIDDRFVIIPEQWEDQGIRIYRDPLPKNASGAVHYTIVFGEGKEGYDLFGQFSGIERCTIDVSVSLLSEHVVAASAACRIILFKYSVM